MRKHLWFGGKDVNMKSIHTNKNIMKIKPEFQAEYDKYVEINSADEYSKCVITCTESFGNAIDEGKTPDEAERIMLDTEDGEGLTGYMVGAIMAAVAHFHPEGEKVRVWWNNRYGVSSEKGTVNPAIVTMKE